MSKILLTCTSLFAVILAAKFIQKWVWLKFTPTNTPNRSRPPTVQPVDPPLNAIYKGAPCKHVE